MRLTEPMEIYETLYVGDVVRMRKQHPCGGHEWEIVRVGADIGLVCQTCGRRVLLTRRKFAKQAKGFVRRGVPAQEQADEKADDKTSSAPGGRKASDQDQGSSVR